MFIFRKTYLVVFIALCANVALAQNGIIKGKVSDAFSNVALSGVTVYVQGLVNPVKSDNLGNYTIQALPLGVYNLTFLYVGYKRKSVFDIAVSYAKPAILDVALETEVSALNEVVIEAPKFIKPLESPLSLRTIGATEIKRNPGGNRQKDGNPDRLGASLTLGSSDFATTVEGPLGDKTTFIASYRLSIYKVYSSCWAYLSCLPTKTFNLR